jgi:hypothetical protein
MNVPERYRLPFAAATSLVVIAVVAGAILLLNRPGPTPVVSPTPSAAASPSMDVTTPEGAIRAFFDALGSARRTDDALLLEGLVTSKASSAYLTAAGFLDGQRAVGKASVLTVNDITDVNVVINGNQATVTFRHRQVGYDIDLKTGQPRESPTVLPVASVRAVVVQSGGRWLVDSFENVP